MAILKLAEIKWRFTEENDHEPEEIKTSLVAIGAYDETVSDTEDENISYYFETEEEFQEAVKNGYHDGDDITIVEYEFLAKSKMMTLEEIKENLCYNDLRNPDVTVDEETAKEIAEKGGDCYCDNCFRGKTELAEELLRLYYIVNKK